MGDSYAIAILAVTWFCSAAYTGYVCYNVVRRRLIRIVDIITIVVNLSTGLMIPCINALAADYGQDAFSATPISMLRGSVVVLIFNLIVFASRWVSFARKRPTNFVFTPGTQSRQALVLGVLIVGIIALSAKYLIFSGGYRELDFSIFSTFDDRSEYLSAREMQSQITMTELGRGVAMFYVALNILSPLLIILGTLNYSLYRRLQLGAASVLFGIAVGIVGASLSHSRSSLAQIFVLPIAAFLSCAEIRKRSAGGAGPRRIFSLNKVLLLLMTLLAGLTTVFRNTSSVATSKASLDVVARICYIPAATSDYYYQLFPEPLPFRGITNAFSMRNAQTTGAIDVSFEDVAQLVTNARFSANAGFLAIGYTGAGYIGAALVAGVTAILLLYIDQCMAGFGNRYKILVILASTYGAMALVNTPLFTAISFSGFGINSILLVWIFRYICTAPNAKGEFGRPAGQVPPTEMVPMGLVGKRFKEA